ncbi:MAG: riboflavin biosynthesis protein RibF [Tannerellaceae bacterium]|jgi:riboflavin kinase/FMN adenylyltransferase|nr:riboflavin biosynthesis protein RibF [Tannerellaceae bacterium]
MIIIKQNDNLRPRNPLAATIGFFDGVHAGHRFLITSLREIAARNGLESAVITFDEHPQRALKADSPPMLLNTSGEKMRRLDSLGLDYCVILPFTAQLADLTAVSFIRMLAHEWNIRMLLVGYDNRFGRNRADGFEQYRLYGQECGMEVIEAGQMASTGPTVSSSRIRKLLAEGKVEEAEQFLSYPYRIAGKIVHGQKIGRTIGFPTANILIDEPLKLIPAHGVYAVDVLINNREPYRGMLYIGVRPTLGYGSETVLEVHIFNFEQEAYDGDISLELRQYFRGDISFGTLDELKEQLQRDKQIIQDFFGNGH